ncbi:hypothetical protein H8S10_11410 [Clostridium sp. NSJ-49]|uniref:hypothetical protein n=1 Tax=Clostridium TaxID=1485 RepID=UPI00164BFF1A|nr:MULTISPECIES: hypothetical protein [unclassified Clostridium]MBC5626062.1 hypothetical protein [Clostridium sp. NSJ-49]MCD2501768.1 hypothetical protein [Clostridium sp. NSJ-145]MDU6340684.1 hypothetical protein [Clostridium sp.]
MSLFLGKIHYWLFNKIQWFEILEEDIIKVAKDEGIYTEEINDKINKKYGEKLPNKPLEDMIDTGNIHGWLQSKINSAEGRMAAWTSIIINNSKNGINKIEKVYIDQGIKAAKEIKESGKSYKNAEEIYNLMNDYVLDGMPCDRVNVIEESSEELVKWTKRICVHKDIWDAENIDVKYFYDFRGLWIKAFVSELNRDFEYLEVDNDTRVIRKI